MEEINCDSATEHNTAKSIPLILTCCDKEVIDYSTSSSLTIQVDIQHGSNIKFTSNSSMIEPNQQVKKKNQHVYINDPNGIDFF